MGQIVKLKIIYGLPQDVERQYNQWIENFGRDKIVKVDRNTHIVRKETLIIVIMAWYQVSSITK